MNRLGEWVRQARRRLALPIAVYPGVALTGARIKDVASDPAAQVAAVAALQERFSTGVVLSAMDLSVEAEAFGSQVQAPDDEVPTIVGRLLEYPQNVAALKIPVVGAARTRVPIETVRRLRDLPGPPVVLGSCIGPFSLAARLVGMTETMGYTITQSSWLHEVLRQSTAFLQEYVKAFRETGADGVLMAEPGAGLLSPRAVVEFSSRYIREIVDHVQTTAFRIVLHNCAARLVHLPAILEAGTTFLHFGVPMDLAGALAKAPPGVTLLGNLDPTRIFLQGTPPEVAAATCSLLESTAGYRNFVISSGCDVPVGSPLANLEVFYEAVTASGVLPG